MTNKITNQILDFFWPQFCLGCHREGSLVCGHCLNDIILEYDNKVSWSDQADFYFSGCYICCHYQNELVQSILKKYKYSYLENMADILTDILEKQARRLSYDKETIVTNVPLHRKKKNIRGFDQTEILAKKLAKRLDLKYYPLLVRTKHTKAQAQLDKKSREQNMIKAFSLSKTADQILADCSKIILIDDVVTTGSTFNQAAKALNPNKNLSVTCLALAKN